jgi:hypothetical protein
MAFLNDAAGDFRSYPAMDTRRYSDENQADTGDAFR